MHYKEMIRTTESIVIPMETKIIDVPKEEWTREKSITTERVVPVQSSNDGPYREEQKEVHKIEKTTASDTILTDEQANMILLQLEHYQDLYFSSLPLNEVQCKEFISNIPKSVFEAAEWSFGYEGKYDLMNPLLFFYVMCIGDQHNEIMGEFLHILYKLMHDNLDFIHSLKNDFDLLEGSNHSDNVENEESNITEDDVSGEDEGNEYEDETSEVSYYGPEENEITYKVDMERDVIRNNNVSSLNPFPEKRDIEALKEIDNSYDERIQGNRQQRRNNKKKNRR